MWNVKDGANEPVSKQKETQISGCHWGGKRYIGRLGLTYTHYYKKWGFSGGSDSKESTCNAGDPGLIPESGRSPGKRNGNSLQYPCLENPLDRVAWQAAVHGVAKSRA